MTIGQKLLELRKSRQLSQEEVAEKLNVTRQTVSKWETDQSMPDFDKIVPLCMLYEISADELLSLNRYENEEKISNNVGLNSYKNNFDSKSVRQKKAFGMAISIILYFLSVAWIMVSIPVLQMNPVLATSILVLICGVATCIIVYTSIVYKREVVKEKDNASQLRKQIDNVVAVIILIIYLLLSFITGYWHITWLLWVVYGLIEEIIKLIFMLRGNDDEK